MYKEMYDYMAQTKKTLKKSRIKGGQNMKKKIALLLVAAMTVASLVACGNSAQEAPAAAETEAPAEEAEAPAEEAEAPAEEATAEGGSVAVFYYTYGDTYISSVRSALDAAFDAAGVAYQDYDSNNSQTTQTEQIDTAIAQGAKVLVVNQVDTGSDDTTKNIIEKATAAGIPVIFFNRSVSEDVVTAYDKAVFVGTDYEMAGHMQGEMIGNYVLENYDVLDLNGDGVISYVMFKGQEGNAEADARTQYGVEDADAILTAAGKEALSFYDSANSNKYLVDQGGAWSAAAATDYLQTALSQYSEANNNMIELVIANNDEMAIGSVTALQNAGYNLEDGSATVIPVFGVDATDAAKEAIGKGTMIGTIKQDAEGMANTIAQIAQNFQGGADKFADVEADNVVGTWRVNIPYATYTGE